MVKEKILFQIQMVNLLRFIKVSIKNYYYFVIFLLQSKFNLLLFCLGCWQHEPDKRPDIYQIISELKEFNNIGNNVLTLVSTNFNSKENGITEVLENEDYFDSFSDCDLSK